MTLDEKLEKQLPQWEKKLINWNSKIVTEHHESKLKECERTGCFTGRYDLEPNGSHATCTYFTHRIKSLKQCQHKIITDDCYGEIHLCQIWKYNNDKLTKKNKKV